MFKNSFFYANKWRTYVNIDCFITVSNNAVLDYLSLVLMVHGLQTSLAPKPMLVPHNTLILSLSKKVYNSSSQELLLKLQINGTKINKRCLHDSFLNLFICMQKFSSYFICVWNQNNMLELQLCGIILSLWSSQYFWSTTVDFKETIGLKSQLFWR